MPVSEAFNFLQQLKSDFVFVAQASVCYVGVARLLGVVRGGVDVVVVVVGGSSGGGSL